MTKPDITDRCYHYKIEADGGWWCENNPVGDQDLFRQLSRSLFARDGRYFVRCQGEVHPVEVVDAPLMVADVDFASDAEGRLIGATLHLADGRAYPLTDSLTASDDNRLYALVGPRSLRAAFDRQAYYRLTTLLAQDGDRFYIPVGGRNFYIAPDRPPSARSTERP